MNAEELFLKHVETIERIAAFVARRNHLDATEAEDFSSEVKLGLIERNYEIIRKFEGRSSFSTYLTTVIQRLFYQYRVKLWGKWRPSAEAKRLGDKAIVIERLLTRDGYSLSEVLQILTCRADALYTAGEIESIYIRLPLRLPRPVLVSEATLPDATSEQEGPEDDAMQRDREQSARDIAAIIDGFIQQLPSEDQLVLQMRFWRTCRVPEIAVSLHLDPKKTYKRIDKLLGRLRIELERAGVSRADVEEHFAHRDQEIRFVRADSTAGNRPMRPSHREDEGIGSGGGRLSG
jgi:RNA polymerase sigma factor (sigma-70 family)